MTPTTYAEIDAATLYDQISFGVRIRLGITRSKIVRDDREVMLPINDSYTRKVIVRLTGADEYDLEYGQVKKFDWVVLGRVEGIGCEQLGETLINMVENGLGKVTKPQTPWTSTPAELFDAEAKSVQESLFVLPDDMGAGDLFD
jgi:hypothetical protein